MNIDWTHVAFSDDSKHKDGRYNSLCLVSLSRNKHEELNSKIKDLLIRSDVKKEFKWLKVSGAKYRFAAEGIINFIFENINNIRIDVLVWDIQDSRHKDIIHRDDNANLARMYYHLLCCVLGKRWDCDCTWCWYPDKQSSIDWKILAKCLSLKKYEKAANLFDMPQEKFIKLGLKIIKVSRSERETFIQIADCFAGLGAWSYGHFDKYSQWLSINSEQKSFFNNGNNKSKFTNREKFRFPVLDFLIDNCKKRKMGISLKGKKGLYSYNPNNNINFWLYEPQFIEDKAPMKYYEKF